SFDMGGTTAKGALIRGGRALRRYEFEVARVHEFKQGSGLPLRIPVIDMIEIGAGGGSIASLDERNLLKVGPASAGAEPGPACYAQGGELPTLTDANVTLGYLQPQAFLGGRMTLDADAARQAIATGIAQRSDLEITRAAWGIHEVINEDVARAFRVHASELGFDYRRCAMVAFGGSGPAHALRIARKLRIPKVIFPVGAGVMSAIGLLTVPISFATLRSARVRLTELDTQGLHAGFASIEDQAARMLEQAGVEPESIVIERRLDMRFYGQGHEVEVSLPADVRVEQLAELFVRTYAQTFAATPLDAEIEIVNWKIEASGPEPGFVSHYQASAPRRDTSPAADPGPAVPTMTTRIFDPLAQTFVDCPVHEREALIAGAWVEGPALIQEREATTVLGVGERLQVDTHGNLVAILSANSDSERARS
ncbi:MAG: hydantoinase/oxoprolinase family protein, partial [Gammaproteobacteria bacterium]|nr:hydantoinase/oxoprolinase family protein [Gammaproteobacteria bacterium]